MTQTEEDFKMLQSHEKIIHEDILPRMEIMQKAQLEFVRQNMDITSQVDSIQQSQTGLEQAQTRLELTVMKDGQETRSLLKQIVDYHFGIDKDKVASNERVTLKRLSTREKIWIAVITTLAGGSGIFAGVVALIETLK